MTLSRDRLQSAIEAWPLDHEQRFLINSGISDITETRASALLELLQRAEVSIESCATYLSNEAVRKENRDGKYILEYIWIDGAKPVQNVRSKISVKHYESFPKLEMVPMLGVEPKYDMQYGTMYDLVLKPVAVYPDVIHPMGALVLCEVMMPDGRTPHLSNTRAHIPDDPGMWVGFEQDYYLYKDGRPVGFPDKGYPTPNGPYFCGVGYPNVGNSARMIAEEHLEACLWAGINHEGINANAEKGQWQFQLFAKGSRRAADDLWIARYLLHRITEKHAIDVEYNYKELGYTRADGYGLRCFFSNKYLREVGGEPFFEVFMSTFTAFNERFTSSSKSIEVPQSFIANNYRGYLAYLGNAAQEDPYSVVLNIIKPLSASSEGLRAFRAA